MLFRFADVTKLSRAAYTFRDRNRIQYYLGRTKNWAQTNKTNTSRDKCEVLHLDRKQQVPKYTMDGSWLESSTFDSDIRVLVDHELNTSHLCTVAVLKDSVIPGYTSRCMTSRSEEVMVPLSSAFIRLQLCVSINQNMT